MNKYLMLKAVKQNWGLLRPGVWRDVTWYVFSDGSYEIQSEFNRIISDEDEKERISAERKVGSLRPEIHVTKGKMKKNKLAELRKYMEQKPWRDPLIISGGCDGVAWEIEQYSEDGKTVNSSGRLDYIYGQSVLEAIVECLPGDGDAYEASAFVTVERLKPNPKFIRDEESRRGLTRLIACGGREFQDYGLLAGKLDDLIKRYEYVEIISGQAEGADKLAEIYAITNNLPIRKFFADWSRYGRAAGPVRNREMLDYALEAHPVVAAFWNGKSRGTANMLEQAKAAGVECHIYLYDETD